MAIKKKTKGKKGTIIRRNNPPAARKRVDISAEALEFKNTELLRKFVTEKGKLLPRRITGLPAKMHRKMTNSVKRARTVLLMK
ncbi:30S ribosomal protein S18 [Oscillatoria amoena NRMC-F 0135]|nr:30S ribosomal protein S18 [Oscillatoria laete-virens]MDL5048685.1 30S ribosomal protein S18 [Oscillatoria amoena NRMC-F 0135]MDL5053222.1 30S ribosomal protein S18 [Oscillatoria laete-virens NRMC-F 0139]